MPAPVACVVRAADRRAAMTMTFAWLTWLDGSDPDDAAAGMATALAAHWRACSSCDGNSLCRGGRELAEGARTAAADALVARTAAQPARRA
jgi:hypothetical protein